MFSFFDMYVEEVSLLLFPFPFVSVCCVADGVSIKIVSDHCWLQKVLYCS